MKLDFIPIPTREAMAELLEYGDTRTYYQWDVEINNSSVYNLVEQALISRGVRNIQFTGECSMRVDSTVRINFDGITGIIGVKEVKAG